MTDEPDIEEDIFEDDDEELEFPAQCQLRGQILELIATHMPYKDFPDFMAKARAMANFVFEEEGHTVLELAKEEDEK